MKIEAEQIRDILSHMTGAPYQVAVPSSRDPLFERNPVWLVRCTDSYYIKQTAHLRAAWLDTTGDIWLVSSGIEFITNMVEFEYGEKGAIKAMRMRLGRFSESEFRMEFEREFPKVGKQLSQYEVIAETVASNRKVHMRIEYSGEDSATGFELTTRIESNDLTEQSMPKEIERNASALLDAYDRIEEQLDAA